MPITTVTPNAGLNLDDEYVNIPNGSYVNAIDVKIKSDGSSNGYCLQNIEGNEFKFTIPDVVAQNKKWLMEQGVDDPANAYTLTLYDAYNAVLATATDVTYAGLIVAFDAALTLAGITFINVAAVFNGNAENSYEFTSIPFYNYKLVNTGNQFNYIYLVKEAIDDAEAQADYTAMKRVLNSCEGTGGVYIFSTNQAQQLNIASNGATVLSANTSNNGSGMLRLETAVWPYGITVGQHFNLLITGCTVNANYNGIHVAEAVDVLGTLYLDIIDVTFGSQETVSYQFYISNYGEIGFVDYENIIYTKIFSTTQWNFNVIKPVDSRSEPSALNYDVLYWTSLQERFRRFAVGRSSGGGYLYNSSAYGGNLVTLYHVLRQGFYDYETIATESLLQIPNISEIEWVSQSESGGALLAGNWRYMNSFISSDGASETELSDLTNVVNVYSSNDNDNYLYVLGNDSTTVTGKVNNLQITGFPLGIYKYVVLYGIHYADGAANIYRIKQQLIDSDAINISHFGTEAAEIVAFNELRFSNEAYKGQNIELIDNRLTFSNLIKEGSVDLTAFALTFTHNITNDSVTTPGEYKNPTNVNDRLGYMVNEDYVFAAQFELTNGGLTDQVYYIDTIRIDGDIVTNAGNPTDNRRVAGGTADMRIADASGIRVIYPQIIIDWDNELIDGVPARDVIKSVKIYRSEVINQRVIACGHLVPCVRDPAVIVGQLFQPSNSAGVYPFADDVFPFPEYNGDTLGAAVTVYPSRYRSEWNGGTEQTFGFYAPDYYFSGDYFSFLAGDQFIINSGITDNLYQSFVNNPPLTYASAYNKYYGDQTYGVWADGVAVPPIVANPDNPYTVSMAVYCPTNSQVDCGSATPKVFHNNLFYTTDVEDSQFQTYSCHAITLETSVDIALTYAIPTAAYGYYIRPRADQYGDVSLLRYSYTGIVQYEVDVPLATTVPIQVNNGGDTFNQLTALKQRVKVNDDVTDSYNNSGASFYTQNRVNAQMRVPISGLTMFYDSLPKIEEWLCNVEQEAFNYNEGYSVYGSDLIKALTPFDPNIETITDYGTRCVWTPSKPAGSIVDDYRTIPPLNFYDFPIVHGRITSHLQINRQLFFWQPLKFTQKYFNSEGQFTTTSGDNIVLGENAVMSRRETDLSSFGSRHKQSIVKGRTDSGRDSAYWLCSDFRKIMRFGADGTVCISDRAKIKSWCELNILSEFNSITNSISGRGISAGWNQKDKEYILTLRYGSSIGADPQFTKLKTISFCEVTNRFVSFYSAWPTIYIPFRDVYLTPDSTSYNWFPNDTNVVSANTGDIYLHNDDVVINASKPTYYQVVTAGSTADIVVNADVINNKLWQNIEVDYAGGTPAFYGAFSNIAFATKTQTGASAFESELALDYLRSQIPLDVSENNLSGIWLKSTFYFDTEAIAKLLRLTVKYLTSNRLAQR